MADETKPNDPAVTTPPVVPPEDNNGSKADAHWQKIADERFAENEKLKKELEEAKKAKTETNEIETLRIKVAEIEKAKEVDRLESDYPDIEPSLLLGRTPEDQKAIVEKQRVRSKDHFEKSIDVNAPHYTQNDLDTQIESIKKSNRNPIEQASEVLRVNRLKREST